MNRQISVVLMSLVLLAGCSESLPRLGMDNGKLKPCPKSPNCVNSQARDKKHFIEPIQIAGTPQEVKERLLEIIASEKRTRVVVNRDDYIRVECRSALFRFVDDVEFYVQKDEGGRTTIHVRSASRVGYSDFGVNRKRIERIRGKFR